MSSLGFYSEMLFLWFFLSASVRLMSLLPFGFIILLSHLSPKFLNHHCCISFIFKYSSNSNNTLFSISYIYLFFIYLCFSSPHSCSSPAFTDYFQWLYTPFRLAFVYCYQISLIITYRNSQSQTLLITFNWS